MGKIDRALGKHGIQFKQEKVRMCSGQELFTALARSLDDGFSLRVSCNEGKIWVSVGDGVVQLQRRCWLRGDAGEAIGWIWGYIDGYRQ